MYERSKCSLVTLEGDEISVVEVDVSELLLELVQGVERAREVVGALDVGLGAVPPAEQHSPAWSSRLRPVSFMIPSSVQVRREADRVK
jgi:hypothetical protein